MTNKIFSVTVQSLYKNNFCNYEKYVIAYILGIKITFSLRNLNIKYIYFCILCLLLGKLKASELYLSKYETNITEYLENDNQIKDDDPNNNKEFIWSMWYQGDIPEIIQICLKSIKSFYPDLIILTKKNLSEYLNIPEYILNGVEKGNIALPTFSDYVRVCLLERYGGIWIDASCLMVNKIPRFITKQDFFILQSPNKNSISSFFIRAKKNNYLIKHIRIFFEEYWKHESFILDYFLFHIYFKMLVKKNKKCKKIYDDIIPDINSKIKYLDYNIASNADDDCWDYLKQTSYIYKIHRKCEQIKDNPNCWYYYILNKYSKYLDNTK